MKSTQDLDDIKKLQAAWICALKAADIECLIGMATDDVVAAHPGGKTTRGKRELAADFRRFFGKFRMDQRATSEETVVAGEWAFDRASVCTQVVPLTGGEPSQVNSEVIVILRRGDDGLWKIARTMSVLR
jgi:ketosteroid isomerase-like protein